MPATPALRRALAVLVTLPCSSSRPAATAPGPEENTEQAVAGAARGGGLDPVKTGHFGNLTHATAPVGRHEGLYRKDQP